MSLTRAEFSRLVADHGEALYRAAFRLLGHAHEAEDAVQETFRSAWTSRERFSSRSELSKDPESTDLDAPRTRLEIDEPTLVDRRPVTIPFLVEASSDRELSSSTEPDTAVGFDRSERAWLIAILRRRIADRWRRRQHEVTITDAPDVSCEAPDPFERGFTDEMQQALDRLPHELREALLWVVVGELTHQEVADLLHTPVGTVLSRVSRARARLREHLLAIRRHA